MIATVIVGAILIGALVIWFAHAFRSEDKEWPPKPPKEGYPPR